MSSVVTFVWVGEWEFLSLEIFLVHSRWFHCCCGQFSSLLSFTFVRVQVHPDSDVTGASTELWCFCGFLRVCVSEIVTTLQEKKKGNSDSVWGNSDIMNIFAMEFTVNRRMELLRNVSNYRAFQYCLLKVLQVLFCCVLSTIHGMCCGVEK